MNLFQEEAKSGKGQILKHYVELNGKPSMRRNTRKQHSRFSNRIYCVFLHLGRCVFIVGVMFVLVSLTDGVDREDEKDGTVTYVFMILGLVFTIMGFCLWTAGSLFHDWSRFSKGNRGDQTFP